MEGGIMRKVVSRAWVAIAVLVGAAVGTAGLAAASGYVAGPLVLVSGASPFAACTVGGPGTVYVGAEVEPRVAVNPTNALNVVGVYQQDRWSNGGAHGLVAASSHDGGATWSRSWAHFTNCAGGTAANGGDYARASDPWVTFAPNGHAYQIGLAISADEVVSAVLVSKSTDGGNSWGEPVTLIRDDNPSLLNDKESITADPTDSSHVYAVWDRLEIANARSRGRSFENAIGYHGPTLFSRTTDGGASWEPARTIFDPGTLNQTLGNQILVLPDGTLVDGFNLIYNAKNAHGVRGENVALLRSTDKGAHWSGPIIAAKMQSVGVVDPDNPNQPVRSSDDIPDLAVDAASGALYAVWQDARFSGFAHDDVAFAMSTDGGLTWSAPVKINKTTNGAAAFTPTVRAASDGTVGVTYYDFRNNTAAAGVPTDVWFVHCHGSCTNPDNWSETHLAGPFDMETAPVARGLFLGDYQGMATLGTRFLPFFVQTNSGNTANRTDVFATTIGP